MEPITPIENQKVTNPTKITHIGGGDQNFMETSKVVAQARRPRGYWKAIILEILGVLCAGSFGYCYYSYLVASLSPWFVLIAFLLWSTVFVLQGFLQKDPERRLLVLILETFALLAFFYAYNWQVLFLSVLTVIGVLFWGHFSMRRELTNSVGVRFFTASGRALGKLMTAAIIFMIAMYASFWGAQGTLFVSQSSFTSFFDWIAGFVHTAYPTIPVNGSLDDFARGIANLELGNNPVFKAMTPSAQSVAITETAGEIIAAFGGNASGTAAITPSEPASDAFYTYILQKMAGFEERFQNGFYAAWGLAAFIVVRGIGIVFVWIAQFFSLIFYEILLATGFMKIGEQVQTKEVVEY